MPRLRKASAFVAAFICSLMVIAAGCTLPVDQPETTDLTLDWSVLLSRSVYPTVYPTPVTWDITLTSPGQTDVTAIGITETTWTFTNIARVNWTVTINGKNAAGEVIVQGGSSVDLTTSATQSLTVDVNYLHNGTGPGQIAITLDMSASPSPIDSVDLTLTDPLGAVTHPPVTVVGYTGTYAAADMPSGSYRAFFLVNAGTKQAMKMETIMVFNELTTDGTIVFAASDFDEPYRPVTGVSLDLTTLDQTVNGPSTTLVATIAPANASNQLMTWASSNPTVATVDQDGLVTPVAEGTTTITVTTVDGGKTATCAVTVTFVHVASITVSPASLTLVQEGSTATLTATILPANAAIQTYSWSSSDETVATVSATGVVTPLLAGSALITATSTEGLKTSTCTITVQPNGQASGGMNVVQPVLNTVTITGSPFMPISGTNPTYTGSYNGTALSYQWFVDGVEAVGATSTTFVPPILTPTTHILTLEVRDQSGLTYSGSRSVKAVENPPNDILSFWFPSLGATATIDGTSISAVLPSGSSLTNLVAAFETNGMSIRISGVDQSSGITVNDFTGPLVYDVLSANGSTKSYTVSLRVQDLYFCGYSRNTSNVVVPGYWKNDVWHSLPTAVPGKAGYAESILFKDGDLYIGGSCEAPVLVPGYWKNDTWIGLPVLAEGQYSQVRSIDVSDQDVYAGGYSENSANVDKPGYWKNGVWNELPVMVSSGDVYTVHVYGSDVYAGGWCKDICGVTIPGYWKNGIWTSLPRIDPSKMGYVTSIVVSDGDVYAGGRCFNSSGISVGVYWKNGTLIQLPALSAQNSAADILVVSGDNVYSGGYSYGYRPDVCTAIPGYWINGTWVGLPSVLADKATSIRSMVLSGDTVYACGSGYSSDTETVACYWINGVLHVLPPLVVSTNASACSMFVY